MVVLPGAAQLGPQDVEEFRTVEPEAGALVPDISSTAPEQVRMWVALVVHKFSIVAATPPTSLRFPAEEDDPCSVEVWMLSGAA